MYRILVLFLLLIASSASAFIVQPPAAVRNAAIVRVGAHQNNNRFIEQATAAAITIAASPLVALAEEVDDYEYGAVDAPIGIAVVGGCLAVLTALLPLLLKGGEEAFEEMKEQDKDKWGKNNSDTLKKR